MSHPDHPSPTPHANRLFPVQGSGSKPISPTYDLISPSDMLQAVDSVPETRGLGLAMVREGRLYRLRPENGSGAMIVCELHTRKTTEPPPRAPHTSPAMEWLGLGLNCGGSVLAWIGVVGTGALAPVTGGASALVTVVLWGGALASTGQCVASIYRTSNIYRGRQDVNDALDNNAIYTNTMLAADGIGLLGAGGALKEVKATNAALHEINVSWNQAAHSGISRPMRRQLTTVLELQGSKHVSGVIINKIVRQHLLDAIGAVAGLTASATSGIIKEAVIWMTSEEPKP